MLARRQPAVVERQAEEMFQPVAREGVRFRISGRGGVRPLARKKERKDRHDHRRENRARDENLDESDSRPTEPTLEDTHKAGLSRAPGV